MAKIGELGADWEEWLAARPASVREVAKRLPPNLLYRLKSTGQRVMIISYGEQEDGRVSLRVNVTGRYNLVSHERAVFGIDPDDLVECELPEAGEALGAVLTREELDAAIASGKTKSERMEAVSRATREKVEKGWRSE